MSSNLTIEKVCLECGNTFVAKTFVTKYCSHLCNSRHYKKSQKAIRRAVPQTACKANVHVEKPPDLDDQTYLEIAEAAQYMRVSKRTLYRLISSRYIRKKKIGSRTVIQKKDIKTFFKQQ